MRESTVLEQQLEQLPERLRDVLLRAINAGGNGAIAARLVTENYCALPKLEKPFCRIESIIQETPELFHMRFIDGRLPRANECRAGNTYHDVYPVNAGCGNVHCIAGWLLQFAREEKPELINGLVRDTHNSLLLADALAAKSGHDVFIDYIATNLEGRRQVYRLAREEASWVS